MSKQRKDKINVDNLANKIRIKYRPKHIFEHLEPLFDCCNKVENATSEALIKTAPHSLPGKTT